MIQSKIIQVTMFLTKRSIDTFGVLIFIQMRTDKKRECKWVCTGKKRF